MESVSWFNICMGIRTYNRCNMRRCCDKRNIWWSEKLITIKYVPSCRSMSNLDKETQWYTEHQVERFARDELERRKIMGVKSRQALRQEIDDVWMVD